MSWILRNLDKVSGVDKTITLIDYFLKLVVFFTGITALFLRSWFLVFICFSVLVFSFLPVFIERNINAHLPVEFELITTLFLVCSLVMGEFLKFYDLFWWWDKFLHTLAGFLLALVGFLIVYSLRFTEKN